MASDESFHRLSHITTLWSLVRQAHQPPGAGTNAEAQETLLRRYGGAVHRYLLGALRDPHGADELFQEFSLRFIRGDFHRAAPEKGRFRDFVKTSLFHLIVDHQKRERRRPRQFAEDAPEVADSAAAPDLDQAFLQSWRDELLDRAWLALAEDSKQNDQSFYDVLRFRAENPGCNSTQMAEQLSVKLAKPLTADGVRQSLHRAREKYADLLLDEVEASLEKPNQERLERELIDLELLSYCRSALDRRAQA